MKPKTRFHKLTAWLLTLAMLMTVIPTFSLTAFAAETVFPIELLAGTSATIDEGTEFEVTYENKSAHGQTIILSDADGLITATSDSEGGILEVSADGFRMNIFNGYDFAGDVQNTAVFEIKADSVSLIGGAIELDSADAEESVMVNGTKVEVVPGRATVTIREDGTATIDCADGKAIINGDVDCSGGTVITIGKVGEDCADGVITLEKGSVYNISSTSGVKIDVGEETISLKPKQRLEYYDGEPYNEGWFTFTAEEDTGYAVIFGEEECKLDIVSGTGTVAVKAETEGAELMYNGNNTVTVGDTQYNSDKLKFVMVGDGVEVGFSKNERGVVFSAGDEPVAVEGPDEGEMYTAYVGKYQVAFYTNGHGSGIEAQQVAHGDKLEEPAAPVAEGYEFMGWYDQNRKKWDFESDSVAGQTDLYAEWKVAEGYYDLFVGGTWVTEANAADVFGDGRVSYVHDAINNSGTLTLNNYAYIGAGYRYYSGEDEYSALIYSGLDDLTIRLEGENVLTNNSSGAFDTYGIYTAFPVAGTLDSLTVQGGGTLKLSGVGYGMLLNGCDLVVDGAELAVDSWYSGIHVSDSGARIESGSTIDISSEGSGIFSFGNLSISGSEITIESMDDGIYAGGDVSVSDSKVTIDAAERGLFAVGDVSVSNSGLTMEATGNGVWIYGDLTVDGSEMEISSGMACIFKQNHAPEIEAAKSKIFISGSEIALQSDEESCIWNDGLGDISINGSTVKIYANEKGIFTFGNIGIDSGNVMIETLALCLDAGTVNIGSGTVFYGKNSDGSGAVRALDAITIDPTLNILIPSEGSVGTLDGVVAIVDEAGASMPEILIGSPAHTWKDKYALNNTHHWKECGAADCCFHPEDSLHRGYEGSAYANHDTNGENDSCSVCGYIQSVTVTFNPNGGGVEPESMETVNGKLESLPTPTRSRYSFNGWFDAETGGNKITTDTVFTENTTVYAQWSKRSSGGGGSSNTTATTTKNEDGSKTVVTENKATGTKTEVTTNIDGSTTTVETKKDGTVTTTEKDKDGNTTTTVEKSDGTSTTTEKNKDGSEKVTEKSADGTTVTTEKDTDGTKTVTTENTDGSKTTEETKKDGTKVTTETNADGETKTEIDLPKDKETEVTIPVDNAEDVTSITVADKDGKDAEITDFEITEDGVKVTVSGDCTVVINKTAKKEFADVYPVNHWATADIDYAYIKGLMMGTSENHFSPDVTLTRAMLVTVLYRLEGEPKVSGITSFADLEKGQYYLDAVCWAQVNGIVNGTTDTTFAPNDNITREQIAAIMHRYAQYKGYDVSVGENTNILSYDDFDSISEYAIASMQWAVGSGLIKGKSESTLNPLDNATRAEIAAILHRFIEANK